MQIEPLLTIKDIMAVFGVSQPTVYRWIALARQGRSRFPLPVGNTKQKLRWSQETILAYQNANSPQPAKVESASQRKKRHNAACESLRKRGVNIKAEA